MLTLIAIPVGACPIWSWMGQPGRQTASLTAKAAETIQGFTKSFSDDRASRAVIAFCASALTVPYVSVTAAVSGGVREALSAPHPTANPFVAPTGDAAACSIAP